MDGRLSYVQRILKNGQKSDLVYAHYKQLFKSAILCTYYRMYIMSKVVKQINPILEMKLFTKPN